MKSEFRIPPPRCPVIRSPAPYTLWPEIRRSKRLRRPTVPFEDRPQLVPIRPIWEQHQEQARLHLKVEVLREVALKKARLQ